MQDVAWTGERDHTRRDRPVRAEQQSVADFDVDGEIESGGAVAPHTRRGARAIWCRRDGLCERALLGRNEINHPARTDGEKADEQEQGKSTHGASLYTIRPHPMNLFRLYRLSKRKEMANPRWECGSRKVRVP